jgi:hypothetical protein
MTPLNRFLLASFLLTLIYINSYAQSVEKYDFRLPDYKITNSLYNKINLIDVRIDSSNMGFIQTGLANKKATVINKTPLNIQLDKILSSLIDNTAKEKELTLVLKKLSFNEVTTITSEKGYFHLNAGLYVKENDNYSKINVIDTIIVASALDVTNKILKIGGETIANFIALNLEHQPSSLTQYAYNDIIKTDDIDRKTFKAYFADTYTNGVYENYISFCSQIPDADITLEGDTIDKKSVRAIDKIGRSKKINMAKTYAFVYKGQPYVVNNFGFYPLKRDNNEFTFIGFDGTASPTEKVIASTLFGIAGGIAAQNAKGQFEMKIDRTSGTFVRVRKATEQPSKN